MTDHIQPFVRIGGSDSENVPRSGSDDRWPAVVRWMRAHFWLAGGLLFVTMLGMLGTLYSEFDNVTLSGRLGLEYAGDIYTPELQKKLLLVVPLGAASMLCLHASALIARRQRGAIAWARAAALIAAAGVIPSLLLWHAASRLGEYDSVIAEALVDYPWLLHIGAGVLFVQASLAVTYQVILSLPRVRRFLRDHVRNVPGLSRFVRAIMAVGLVMLLIAGGTLGVLTRWLYEVPVAVAGPGEVLYATSFDAYADDWDSFQGRDQAQMEFTDGLNLTADNADFPAVVGGSMVITYGSPIAGGIVWSALDRIVRDFDLRVTAQQVSGPADQSQFGVIFRYRDVGNFYVFRITGDGWYKLIKMVDGVEEIVSDWGQTDAIHTSVQGAEGETTHRANVIRIVGQGDQFMFWVNGQPLALCLRGTNATSMWTAPGECFTDEPIDEYTDSDFAQGRIALAVGSLDGNAVSVAFDDLVLVGPEQKPS